MSVSVKDKVVEIIAEQAVMDPSEVEMSATLEDLGIDSMGLVEAVFAIEEAFDISVPFNANDPADSEFDITNVASMVGAVEGIVAKKNA
ncbi:acyl carrier protein [Paracoccaceae bacterium GXU_MW_L88]